MRKFYLFLYGFIFTILTLAVFLVGCGGSAGDVLCHSGEGYCADAGKCCPDTSPYRCNDGACEAASANCDDGHDGFWEKCDA